MGSFNLLIQQWVPEGNQCYISFVVWHLFNINLGLVQKKKKRLRLMLLIMAKIFSGHNFKKWPLFYSAVWWSVILQQDLFIILTCGLCRKKCWKSFSQICHQIYVILVVWIINDLEHNKMFLIFKKKKSVFVCLFLLWNSGVNLNTGWFIESTNVLNRTGAWTGSVQMNNWVKVLPWHMYSLWRSPLDVDPGSINKALELNII